MRISLTSGLTVLLLCAVGWGCTDLCEGNWRQCSYTVEVVDETRQLNAIYGTSRCEPEQRITRGATGIQTFRLALVDDNPNAPEAIDVDGLDKDPWNLSAKSFQVMQDESGPLVEVRDATTGALLPRVKAAVSVITDDDSFSMQPNPRHVALQPYHIDRRTPLATSLLLDMSGQAALTDSKNSRTAGIAKWLRDGYFNLNTTRGDFDIFSMVIMGDDNLSTKSLVFYQNNSQGYSSGGVHKGYLHPTRDNMDTILEKILALTNQVAGGKAPIYAAISAVAKDLRSHARDGSTLLYNPQLTAIVLSRDVAEKNPNKANELYDMKQRLRGSGWPDREDPSTADFVPFSVVAYPRPNGTSQNDWDDQINKLCEGVSAGGESKNRYFGGLFELLPSTPNNTYKDQVTQSLKAAFHLQSKGYIELKIRYSLKGANPGQRYAIRFKLRTKLLRSYNSPSATPYLRMTVIP